MKVFIDAQLPFKLAEILNNLGFEAIHVEALPLKDETPDSEIMRFSDTNKFGGDYQRFRLLPQSYGFKSPEKLLLITTGNIKNKALFDLFRSNHLLIKELLKSCNYIELSNEGLIAHS